MQNSYIMGSSSLTVDSLLLLIATGFPLFTLLHIVSFEIELTDKPAFSSASLTIFLKVPLGTLASPSFFACSTSARYYVAQENITFVHFKLLPFLSCFIVPFYDHQY
jgi:hypothetical protein